MYSRRSGGPVLVRSAISFICWLGCVCGDVCLRLWKEVWEGPDQSFIGINQVPQCHGFVLVLMLPWDPMGRRSVQFPGWALESLVIDVL